MKDINWENYTTVHKETIYEYEFIECLRDNFLFQHITDITRIRENQTPHTLDLVITKDENDIDNIVILHSLGVSDHVLIKFDYVCSFKEKCFLGNLESNTTTVTLNPLLKNGKV